MKSEILILEMKCNEQRLTLRLNGEDMGQHNREFTAYCGLFCGDCIRFKSEAPDLALHLLDELRKIKFENYVKVKQRSVNELESYKEMISALEAISKLKCDIPCRSGGDGCLQPCEIVKCVHLKDLKAAGSAKSLKHVINSNSLSHFMEMSHRTISKR